MPNPDERSESERAADLYLAVWQGDAAMDELDGLMTADYVGHMGARRRDLRQLRRDIEAYRASAPGVRFRVEHRFSSGPYVVTRLSATALRSSDGVALVAAGLNVSRWEGDRLAEEWAVWEPLHPAESAHSEPSTG